MSTSTVLLRAGRAEWARLWSVRSTWLLAGAAALAVVGLGALAGVDAADGEGSGFANGWEAARFTTMFALLGGGSLLGVGLGLLLRSTPGALVEALALLLVLPLVLGNLPFPAAVTLAAHLPGAGAMYLVFGEGPGDALTDGSAALVLAG